MAHTITGKLNQDPTQFKAGETGFGFGVRVGVKFRDRESGTDQWTNYEAVLFANSPSQIALYQQVLVKGAVIEISGDKQKIKVFNGANGPQHTIELLEAKLGFFQAPQNP